MGSVQAAEDAEAFELIAARLTQKPGFQALCLSAPGWRCANL